MTPGRVYECSYFKNLSPKIFDFCKILKIQEKIKNPQIFYYVFVSYSTKRRCSQKEPQLKVEIEDVREMP